MATRLHHPARVQLRFADPGAVPGPERGRRMSPIEVLVRAFLVGLGLGIVLVAGPSQAWSVAAVGSIAIGSALLSWGS